MAGMPSDSQPIPGMIPGAKGGYVMPGKNPEGDPNTLRRFDALTEIGASGLQRTGTWRATVEFDWQPQLRSSLEALKALREIAFNEPIAFAGLQAVDLLLRQVEWRVEPHKPDNLKMGRKTTKGSQKTWEEQAAFVDSCRHDMDMPWSSFISEALTMLPFGFSLMEMVFKRRKGENLKDPNRSSNFDDRKVGWARFAPRAQETIWQWVYDDAGNLIAARQQPPPDYTERVIPLAKCLHFRTRSWRDSPYGVSVLRGAWIPAYYLKRLREIEGIGVERDLTGMPVAFVPEQLLVAKPSDADLATRNAIQNMLQNVRRDAHEGMMFPLSYDPDGNKEYEFALMASGGSRQSYIGEIITRYEQRVATSLMTDFMLLGQGEGARGSYALSADKTTLFSTALECFLDVIADQLNNKAIPLLYKLNGWDPSQRCKIMPGEVGKQDATLVAGFLSQMAASGAPLWPNPELFKHVIKLANLPEPSDEVMADMEEAGELQRRQQLQMAGLDENGDPLPPEPDPNQMQPQEEEDPFRMGLFSLPQQPGPGSKPMNGGPKPPGGTPAKPKPGRPTGGPASGLKPNPSKPGSQPKKKPK